MIAALTMATPAGAVPVPGENGRIVLTSGRDTDADATAQLFLLPVPSNTVGGGTISAPITPVNLQHRHATWSPDRTMIAYARGDSTNGNFDIYVQDLTSPGSVPLNITNSNNVTDDRPAWSPDGTRIAYQSEVTDASGQTDVLIQPAPGGGAVTNFTNTTTAGQFEGKPAWTPTSGTIYYEKGNPNAATNLVDIKQKPAGGGAETVGVPDSGINEFQPAISPDGTKVCYTLASMGFNASADVLVAPTTPPTGGTIVSKDAVGGDYNCTWSPDSTLVAYVNGIFGAGQLVMLRGDNTSLAPINLAQDPGADNFDGNPDWAPDGRPLCPDSTVTTPRNTPITLNLECTDTGPAYEQTDPNGSIANDGAPANGTTSDNAPLANPSTLKYTPNQNFTGTDTVKFRSFDDFGFGTDQGTITINVRAPAAGGGAGGGPGPGPAPAKPKCGGKTATIVGTAGKNRLRGTRRADVIVGLGGNDTITGGGGRDRICGGTGRDRIGGGASNDRIAGGSGNDRVGGGSGNDSVKGESGNDNVKGDSGNDSVSGGSGNDKLGGGTGRDRLDGGSGKDGLNGGSGRDRCKGGGGGKDRGSRCEQRSTIP